MRKTVYWIEGDGIGPDVWKSARPVIDEAIRLSYGDERGFDWRELPAGEKALRESGKLILCLSDQDLLKMANMWVSGDPEPAQLLSDKLDNLLIHLEK